MTLPGNWTESIRHAIVERDHEADGLAKLDAARISMAYYGDLSNQFLESAGKGEYPPQRRPAIQPTDGRRSKNSRRERTSISSSVR